MNMKTQSALLSAFALVFFLASPAMSSTTANYNPVPAGQTATVLFIDAGVQDKQALLSGLATGVNVVTLQDGSDGVWQIAETLKGYRNLDSIQIVSHGAPGKLELGSTSLTDANVDAYQSALQAWGGALKASGNILLYGCNAAQGTSGDRFVNRIAVITGAAVAASTDPTGSQALGGNWALEKQTGPIDTHKALSDKALLAYDHLLVLPNGVQDVADTMANGTPTLASFITGFTFNNTSGLNLVGDPTGGANGIFINSTNVSGGFSVNADNTTVGAFDLTAVKFTNPATLEIYTITITGHKSGGGTVSTTAGLNGNIYIRRALTLPSPG
jgi:hypothetical protein